jgi:hypothetical protein
MVTRQKYGGRKKGSPNKTTIEIRDAFQILIENNLNQLQDDLDYLEPLARIKILIELSKFILPQMKAVDVNLDAKPEVRLISLGFGVKPEEKKVINT